MRYYDPETGRFVTNPNVERVEKPVGVEKKGKEFESVRKVESVQDVSKGTGNNSQIEFTRGFDVDPKYSSYEQRVKTTPLNKGE